MNFVKKIVLASVAALPVGIDKCEVAALSEKGDAILLGNEQRYLKGCRKKVGQKMLILYNLYGEVILGV